MVAGNDGVKVILDDRAGICLSLRRKRRLCSFAMVTGNQWCEVIVANRADFFIAFTQALTGSFAMVAGNDV